VQFGHESLLAAGPQRGWTTKRVAEFEEHPIPRGGKRLLDRRRI
jgi:hypothetical protein